MKKVKNKVLSKKKKRIFIGVQEIAGFAMAYAKGLRALGYDATFVTYHEHIFNYSYDKLMSVDSKIPVKFKYLYLADIWFKHFINFFRIFFFYDYFIFIFGRTLFPNSMDLKLYKFFKKKTAVVFLGCDLRMKSLKLKDNPNNILCINCTRECKEELKTKRVKFIEKYIDVIYAQPEYAQVLQKNYNIVFVPIDINEWKPPSDYFEVPDVPLIIHIPSNEAIKGTKYVLEAIEKLKLEDIDFDFKLIENVSNKEVKEYLNKADILIDQLLVGWHGRLTVEAMALGKVVLCHLDEKYVEKIPDIPVVNVSVENIYEKLKHLLINKEQIPQISQRSREFVETYHDINKIAPSFINAFNID